VVGNSFGERVALDFALSHPARTTPLVLVGSALSGQEGSAFFDEFDEEEEALLDDGAGFSRDLGASGQRHPGAESAKLEAAHLPALERPEDFNRIVLDFLARAEA
jgi:pimeloyl-ACP methyl ester carboxylesterase